MIAPSLIIYTVVSMTQVAAIQNVTVQLGEADQ